MGSERVKVLPVITTVAGMKVVADPDVPPGEVHLRQGHPSRLVGKIIGVDWSLAPTPEAPQP